MPTAPVSSTTKNVAELVTLPEIQRAFAFIDSHLDEITEEQIQICSIPASPFGEGERALYLKNKFAALGFENPYLDEEGNCLALRQGRDQSPLLVVSAHLDTVFAEGTDFSVRKVGGKLLAPGISDDGCGLVALIAMAQALNEAQIETEGPILFVGTVGEEGEGDLRGVKYLFSKGEWSKRIDAFVSFDGAEIDRITNKALGSRRYRVTLRGAGGHSWGDFGIANPVHALGRAVTKLASYPVPIEPRTTFNVGRIEGGKSVNSIPQEAVMDVDLRSADAAELLKLDAFFRRAVREAADDENAAGHNFGRPLELKVDLIGERPGGETPPDSPLVKLAWDATEAVGTTPALNQASTDSNFPISLGIPAITLGGGGRSANAHTLEEWYDSRQREDGLKRALLVILGVVGINSSIG